MGFEINILIASEHKTVTYLSQIFNMKPIKTY